MDIDKTDGRKSAKKRGSNRHCFVPKCTTGYKKNKRKTSLFNVPKDFEKLRKWKMMIPRKDKELGPFDVVCEKHFKEECIERFYRHVINGEEVLLPRGKPKLLDGALPTEYPDLPSYCTMKLPTKRNGEEVLFPRRKPKLMGGALPTEYQEIPKYCTMKLPTKRQEPDTKEIRMDDNNDVTPDENLFSNPNLPSEYWAKINFQNQRHIYAFGLWTKVDANMPAHFTLKPERLVVVKQLENKTANCCVYINGCQTLKDQIMYAVNDLENLLIDLAKKTLCKGSGFLNEFVGLEVNQREFHVQDNLLRHKLCNVVADGPSMCLSCKYARKRLLDKRSKCKKKNLLKDRKP